MKKLGNPIWVLCVVFWAVMPLGLSLGQDPQVEMSVYDVLFALRNGNVEALLDMSSDEEYQRLKRLVDNPRYSGFLRNLYADSEFHIAEVRFLSDETVEVDVEVISGGQVSSRPAFTFTKESNGWKFTCKRVKFLQD